MYILADWAIANGTFFHLVSGIYGTVARLYDVIIQVSSNSDMQVSLKISDFANTIYVLAGVFMLFRVAIGMIQMLINPDKVTDKQVGAGKMLTRIVTCVILLWAFYPSGVLLKPYDKATGDGGMLPRIEQAVLGTNDSEGLFDTILKNKDRIGGNPFDFSKDSKVKSKSCYYFSATKDNIKYYKINFKTGQKDNSKYKEVKGSNGIYYEVVSGVMGGKNSGSGINYSSIDGQLKYGGDMVTKKGNLKCPKALNKNGNHYTSSELGNSTGSIVGGYTSIKEMQKDVEKISDGNKNILSKLFSSKDKIIDNVLTLGGATDAFKVIAKPFISWKIDGIVGDLVDYPLLTDLENRDASLSFAQAAATSFQECIGDDTEECHEVQDRMFGSTGGDHDAVKLIGNDKLNVDFFFSWIFGLAIIVYLIFLIVDIIIRKFKLVLLEFLSPIPIVCYADPSDKVFNRWLKIYFSTYVDIFIKLFALNVALILLGADLIPNGSNILLKILYIVAILVFAKVVPSMLSKIFGLDSMGGSFKDIGKMFKRGVGIGAGAAVGAAVGGITGGVAGAFTGVARGAGAGFKGNISGGAKSIALRNDRVKEAKANGLGFWQRQIAGISGNIGYSPKTKMDNQIKDQVDKKQMLDDFRKHKKNIEDMADSSNYMSDIQAIIASNPNSFKYGNKEGKDAMKAARSDFIKLNENNIKTKDSDGNDVIMYKDANNEWQESHQSKYYVNEDGSLSGIKYEKGAKGKIAQAERIMRDDIEVNTALQKELGKNVQDVQSFAAYEKVEDIARAKSNNYESSIRRVTSGDEYHKAQAFEEFSNGSKQ